MPNYREELLQSDCAFDGRLLQVRVDTVRLPDGSEATREIVVHPGSVAAVPILGRDVILVRQWRQPLGDVTLEIPAGTLGRGEDPEDCVARELQEEIGYSPGRLTKLFALALAPGYSNEIIRVYLAEDLKPSPAQQDPDERVSAERLPFNEAVGRCLAGEIPDAKTVAGLLAVAFLRSR
ncbi:MAG: NUDIX domain-containing protein [Armatimonadota bacterium]